MTKALAKSFYLMAPAAAAGLLIAGIPGVALADHSQFEIDAAHQAYVEAQANTDAAYRAMLDAQWNEYLADEALSNCDSDPEMENCDAQYDAWAAAEQAYLDSCADLGDASQAEYDSYTDWQSLL
ncbi:MAG TPA: hypothetical protein VG839_04985 [Asticcacaulis sp.]|nr:hypothetical protein [Asticcacaulis sp.]